MKRLVFMKGFTLFGFQRVVTSFQIGCILFFFLWLCGCTTQEELMDRKIRSMDRPKSVAFLVESGSLAVPRLILALGTGNDFRSTHRNPRYSHSFTRRKAVEVLGLIGPSAKEAIPKLISWFRMVADKKYDASDESISCELIKAIVKIAPDQQELVSVLSLALKI